MDVSHLIVGTVGLMPDLGTVCMDNEVDVLNRLAEAMRRDRVISFCHESPDHHYPEIVWQIFGLIDTNEVVVTARCGEFQLGISEESWLLYPTMVDRIFGIDQADYNLAMELANRLWAQRSAQLIEIVTAIRSNVAR